GAGSIVTDGRARARTYLEQQRLLGGDSVILSPTNSPPTSPSAVGRTGGQADGKLDRPGTALPPPGISFDPPSGDLFTSDPLPQYDEIAACAPYLFRQIELLKPKVVLAMGGTAAQTLLNTKQSVGGLRNQVHRFRGVPVIVTYHPAALLRNPNWKKPTWDDVRIARRLLD